MIKNVHFNVDIYTHGFPHVNNFLKKPTHILLHKKSKSMNPKNLTFFSYEAHSSFIVLFSPLTKHNLFLCHPSFVFISEGISLIFSFNIQTCES